MKPNIRNYRYKKVIKTKLTEENILNAEIHTRMRASEIVNRYLEKGIPAEVFGYRSHYHTGYAAVEIRHN